MFKKSNFCHVASNNRNEQKAGIFVYKTTDNLEAVETSGYFNEKIIDINLHDLILHVQYDPVDKTKVSQNLLCVTERTLDNVKAELITSDWEKTITTWSTVATQAINARVKIDGTSVMTAPLKFTSGSMRGAVGPYLNGVGFWKMDSQGNLTQIATLSDTQFLPANTNALDIGSATRKWKTLYIGALNNGYDIAVPVTAQPETLALKSEVDLAANSGRMITDEGVWYAKMEAAGTIPAAAEVEGRNYADFTQTDQDNNPIIVIYTYTSGAWVQTETITPPAAYDGYVPVTSKIWDIPEQTGQQGGRILWNHQSKEFTPYPMIISYENINVTGDSTVAMPVNPGNTQIVNKNYVDNTIAAILGFDLFDFKWRDATTNNTSWALSDGSWKTNANGLNQLISDVDGTTQVSQTYYNLGKVVSVEIGSLVYFRYPSGDSTGSTYPYCWNSGYSNGKRYTATETPAANDTAWADPEGATTSQTIVDTRDYIQVNYRRATNGRKIVWGENNEPAVEALYYATGVAWYYVLNSAKTQFKLPRTQFGFVGLRGSAGDYVQETVPNITGTTGDYYLDTATGAFALDSSVDINRYPSGNGSGNYYYKSFDASRSSSAYVNGAPVQQRATQMYLYFYVGQ